MAFAPDPAVQIVNSAFFDGFSIALADMPGRASVHQMGLSDLTLALKLLGHLREHADEYGDWTVGSRAFDRFTKGTMILNIRLCISTILFTSVAGCLLLMGQKPPEKLTFESKMGKVTFDHAAHVKRANNDCKTCHDKYFQQSAKADLNWKGAMHKTAETAKTSCGGCHNPAGPSFETKGNCAKCHVKD